LHGTVADVGGLTPVKNVSKIRLELLGKTRILKAVSKRTGT